MRRRALGSAVLAAGLLTSGLAPMLGQAHAAACPTWTDPKDDATTSQNGNANLRDASMDILSASFNTVDTDIVAVITVQELNTAAYTDLGDRYIVQGSFGGSIVQFIADRDELGSSAKVANVSGTAGAATAVWDHLSNTVSITTTQAELDKAAGKPTKGVDATNLTATAGTQAAGNDLYLYDHTNPTPLTFTVGAACTPPLSKPSLPMPRAGCFTIDDKPGGADGTPKVTVAAGPNDKDLDIKEVAVNTTATELVAYLKVDALSAKPANYGGDVFEFEFKVGAKLYTFDAGRFGPGKHVWIDPTNGAVDGTPNDGLKVRGTFDVPHNTVVITVDRASLDTVNGAAVANGTKVTDVVARTYTAPGGFFVTADTAQATAVTDRVYTIGDAACFTPPGVLTNVGKTTAQYTDAAAVAAKLTANDAPLAGKTVTFKVGSKSVSAKTGADGVAKAALNPGLAAGTYSLVTSFAGDSDATAVTLTTPFKVTAEKTKIVLSVAKSGTRRTVTAKLLDDDNHPVAGQVVAWYVNGKKVAAPKTNSAGVVTLTTAKPTQTVKAVYAGATGKFLGSSAQAKV